MLNFLKKKNGGPTSSPPFQKQEKSTTTVVQYNYSKQFNEIEQTIIHLDELQLKMAEKGRTEGAQGIPSPDITGLHTTERMLRNTCQEAIDHMAGQLGQEKARTETRIQQLEKDIATAIDTEKTATFYREETVTEESLEKETKQVEFESKTANYTGKIFQAEKVLARREVDREKQIDARNGNVPTQKWWHKNVWYYSILTVLGVLEVSINSGATLYIGETSNVFSIIMALVLSLAIIPCGHFLAEGIFEKDKVKIIGGISGSIFIFTIVVVLRYESEQIVIFALINIVVFIIALCLSLSRTKNQQFFLNEAEIKLLTQRIGKWNTAIKEMEILFKQQCRTIEEKYRTMANRKAKERLETLRNELQTSELHLVKCQTSGENIEKEINAKFKASCNAYRSANRQQRNGKFPLVKLWETQELPNLVFSFSEGRKNKKSSTPIRSKINKFFNLNIFLVFAFFTFGSCQSELAPPSTTTDVLVLADLTGSMESSLDNIPEYVTKDILRIKENEVNTNGATVTVSTIQQTVIQKTNQAHLGIAADFLTRTDRKRKEDVVNFSAEIQQIIEAHIKKAEEQKSTELMASFCQHLPKLAQSSANKKVVLLFSDLLQHNREISFYDYKKRPKKMRKAYEKIVSKLENECVLNDLNGIEIRVIHLPNDKTDRLFLESFLFFKKYLETKGATVIHLPNI